jgi:hypothetical protein
MTDDRSFLSALVGQVVAVDAVVQSHGYSPGDGKGNHIGITTIAHVLVTTSSGRHLIGHLHCRNCNQLRSFPPQSRVRFSAKVKEYQRADGTRSFGLGTAFDIALVAVPPFVRTAREEVKQP